MSPPKIELGGTQGIAGWAEGAGRTRRRELGSQAEGPNFDGAADRPGAQPFFAGLVVVVPDRAGGAVGVVGGRTDMVMKSRESGAK
jgi:hypothetical protein